MFVLQKKILFARGLNWDQSCLWKTPPSHFLLFSPLACPYFFNFFSSPDFWGVKEAPCKNLYVFGENWQRNQFPKLTTFLLHFSPMSPLCHSVHWDKGGNPELLTLLFMIFSDKFPPFPQWDSPLQSLSSVHRSSHFLLLNGHQCNQSWSTKDT